MQHYYKEIKGYFGFRELYRRMVASHGDGAVFVEVGTYRGKSAAFLGVEIANSGKRIQAYTVDHFRGSPTGKLNSDPDLLAGRLEAVARLALSRVSGHVHVMAMRSTDAASQFADASVDFVFLDGAHDYASVRDDLAAWLPKLKPDGAIAGDDWNWDGVQRAVVERFGATNVEVLGEGKSRHWIRIQ